jgi:hypothetical protein
MYKNTSWVVAFTKTNSLHHEKNFNSQKQQFGFSKFLKIGKYKYTPRE